MKLIVALTADNAMGKDNKLIVHDKNDMAYFRKYTIGSSVVMGRKTWESLGTKPLPLRTNYVITSQAWCSEHPDVVFIKSLAEAPDDAIVIGGKQVYLDAMFDPRLTEVSITQFWDVRCKDADVYFPEMMISLLSGATWGQTGHVKLDPFKNRSVYIFKRRECTLTPMKTPM